MQSLDGPYRNRHGHAAMPRANGMAASFFALRVARIQLNS